MSSGINKKNNHTATGKAVGLILGIFVIAACIVLAGIGIYRAQNFAPPVNASNISVRNTLSGTQSGTKDTAPNAQTSAAAADQGQQVIYSTMSAGSRGYPNITVKKGVPVVWTIHIDKGALSGCNNVMELSDFGLEIPLKEGDNLINFTPDKTGSITYTCWMGMTTGRINVQ